jgi:anti-sigma-K factor RskA/putative zinc finger protein
VTHEEIQELLAGYALNALEPSEEEAVAEHLAGCPDCESEYLSLQGTVDRLAEAPAQQPTPDRMRSRVLASAEELFTHDTATEPAATILPFRPATTAQRRPVRRFDSWQWTRRLQWVAAAALVGALSFTTVNGIGMNRQNQAELTRDQAALALLTSTETTNNLLSRVPDSSAPADAHGHWFHRPGVMTQVCVGEFLSQPPAGRFYEVWFLQPSGWSPAGRMDVDASGYGRVIVLGSDGSGVSSVEVTLEQGQPSQPSTNVALRYV